MTHMRIYVHDEKTSGIIERVCRDAGVSVLTIQDVRKRAKKPEPEQAQQFFLDTVDALVLEITHPTQDIHFILAQAIIREKPTLCLYGKNQTPRDLLSFIKKDERTKMIKTFSFVEDQLPEAVTSFIRKHDPEYNEQFGAPEIKFTLRLTTSMNEFLEAKAAEQGSTKADIMRDIIRVELAKHKAASRKKKAR